MPQPDDGFAWFWGPGTDLEMCRGPHPTRLEAIAAAFRESNPGDTVTVLEANFQSLRDDFFEAGEVMEQFESANEDLWGEDGAEPDPLPVEAEKELENALYQAFAAWRAKYQPWQPWTFGEMRNQEVLTVPWTLGRFWHDLHWKTRGRLWRLEWRIRSAAHRAREALRGTAS